MNILHIETSSRNCSVAVSRNDQLLSLCQEVSENYKQSESLHTFVKWALEGAKLNLQEIQGVSLGKGPGSYTGLRIGASAAKGFCFGLNIPLVAIDSMDTMVLPFLGQGYDYIIPLIDARRMEVYTQVYNGITGEVEKKTESLILTSDSFQEYSKQKVLFLGDGATKSSGLLDFPEDSFISNVFPSAKYLIQPAYKKFAAGENEDIAYFEPFYLKDFHGLKKNEQ